jgi:hypothetical protein
MTPVTAISILKHVSRFIRKLPRDNFLRRRKEERV